MTIRTATKKPRRRTSSGRPRPSSRKLRPGASELRLALATDVRRLHALAASCLGPADAFTRAELRRALEQGFALLGWDGFALVTLDGNRAVIAALGVLPARRRLGAGTKLIGAAVKECRRRGCRLVTCETRAGNIAPQDLLLKAGFNVVGMWPRYYADDEAAVAFELRLRRPRPTAPV